MQRGPVGEGGGRVAGATIPTLFGRLALLLILVAGPPARAVTFHVAADTVGDGYQLVTSDGELLNRRRLHQALGLSAHDLLGDGSNSLSFVSLMRFDGDFGVTDDELDEAPFARRWQLSIQTAYLEGRDLFGFLDFRLARVLHPDPIDYLLLDGLVATLKLPFHLGVEVLVGLEAKNELGPVTSSQLELDGLRYMEGEAHNDALTVAVGAALVVTEIPGTRARIGYRRLFSEGHVDQEKLGAALFQSVAGRLQLSAAASLDLVKLRVDSADLLVRGLATDALVIEAQYVHVVPSFDADSIFNVFSTRPLNDLNVRARYHFSDAAVAHLGGMVRFFESAPRAARTGAAGRDELVEAYGAMAGYRQSWGRDGWIGGAASYEDGYGGRSLLVDLGGLWGLVPGEWELEGRVSAILFSDAVQPDLHAAGFGYQLGGRYLVDDRAAISLLVEHNFNRLHRSQLRVFLVAHLGFFL